MTGSMSLCVCLFQFSKVKPFIIRGPYDQTVVEGSSVTFQCRVGGEPVPDILCENNFYIIFFFLHLCWLSTIYSICFRETYGCRWQHAIGYIKFISKLYTLIKSNQFISEFVGWLEFSMDCIFIAIWNSNTHKFRRQRSNI